MRFFLLLVLTILIINVNAQVKIVGKVLSNDRKALAGVSIAITDSYDGATTDASGRFSFRTDEKGKVEITATSTGYKPYSDTIRIVGDSVVLQIVLKKDMTSLQAVVISAGAFEASDQKKATALDPLDIVTTASANGDITNALKTLPGSQQVGESEGLFVRGGTAQETKFFIDGSLVNNFFFSSEPGQATRGRFNPFLFKGTVFSSGGYSALYGEALSSAVILESLDLPEKTSASFGLSYLAADAGIQKLSKNKKSSWGATYAYTNLALVYGLIKQKFDYFKVPIVHMADFNFRIKTSRTGMLKYYAMLGTTDIGFRNQDVDSLSLKDAFTLQNLNIYQNISWREVLGKGWKVRLGGSYTNNRDKINMELQENERKILPADPFYAAKNFDVVKTGNYYNGKVVFEKRLAALNMLRFGSEITASSDNTNYSQNNDFHFSSKLNEKIVATFAESDLYITEDIAAKIGVRSEHSKLLDKWNLAPRISLAYRFPDRSQVSFAYGDFYQAPDLNYLPSVNSLHFSKATHYILQYQKIANLRTFRIEGFYKKYDDLLKIAGPANQFVAINNEGFGDAKGVELFWRDKKTIPNFDYWISYSYLDTKRDFLNYPRQIQPSFATKHTASVVVKKFVLPIKTQFNASYTFATGRPYYNIQQQANQNYKIIESGFTGNYNDLSLSVNYVPSVGNLKAKGFSVWVLSVTNVLGANNVYTYNFSANGQNKVAVTPPAKRFIYLGWFLSLGIDRTEDVINNHL